jgi:hypothetical protein
MNRRDFLVSAGAVAASSTLPLSVAAQPMVTTSRERKVLEIARRQISRLGSRVPRRDRVAIVDFSAHSADRRFYLANLVNGTVELSGRVAHGTGSDPDNDGWLTRFSNMMGSNATSRGAYLTHDPEESEFGTWTRLTGLDSDNASAFDRSIAIYSADYCTASHVLKCGRIGRSNGSFALAPEDLSPVLEQLSGGRLVYGDRLDLV